MLRKWAFIISLIAVLGTFAQVHAVENYDDLEITESQNEGDELSNKLEEEADDDDSSSASESEDIQDAYSFIHPDKSMEVNKDNVSELISELSQYSNSYAASEEEKVQINKWIAILEAKYKKLNAKETRPKARKERDAKKAPETPAVIVPFKSKFETLTNEQLFQVIPKVDPNQLPAIRQVLALREEKATGDSKIKIQEAIQSIDNKTSNTSSTASSETPNSTKTEDKRSSSSESESREDSSKTSSDSDSASSTKEAYNSLLSDPYFKHSDLKTILATEITGLSLDQLNHLNNRLNQEIYKSSAEVKKEIRSKIIEVKELYNTRIKETQKGSRRNQTGDSSSQGNSKSNDSRDYSTSQSSASGDSSSSSADQGSAKKDSTRGSAKPDDSDAGSTPESDDVSKKYSKKFLKSDDQADKKPVRRKVSQSRSMPANATKSNASSSVYSIQDTVDRLRVIDLSRSISALDE